MGTSATPIDSVHARLVLGRQRLDNPNNWIRGRYFDGPGTMCIVATITSQGAMNPFWENSDNWGVTKESIAALDAARPQVLRDRVAESVRDGQIAIDVDLVVPLATESSGSMFTQALQRCLSANNNLSTTHSDIIGWLDAAVEANPA